MSKERIGFFVKNSNLLSKDDILFACELDNLIINNSLGIKKIIYYFRGFRSYMIDDCV